MATVILAREIRFRPHLDTTWSFTYDLELPDGMEPTEATRELGKAIWTHILRSGLYHPPKWWQWWRWCEERPPAGLCTMLGAGGQPTEKEDLPPLPEPHGE
jgi:hypothetical protein